MKLSLKSLLVVSSLCFCVSAFADDQYGAGYFLLGYDKINLSKLNTTLKDKNYPTFKESYVSFGGGGHFIHSTGLLLGGEGNGFTSSTKSSGTYDVQLSGGSGSFNIGYAVVKDGPFTVFPYVGLGGSGVSVHIAERSRPTFGEVLDNPKRETTVNSGSFTITPSVGTDYFLVMNEKEGRSGGFLVGVRVGYRISVGETEWRGYSSSVADGPAVNTNGLFLRFSLGGGGYGPRKE